MGRGTPGKGRGCTHAGRGCTGLGRAGTREGRGCTREGRAGTGLGRPSPREGRPCPGAGRPCTCRGRGCPRVEAGRARRFERFSRTARGRRLRKNSTTQRPTEPLSTGQALRRISPRRRLPRLLDSRSIVTEPAPPPGLNLRSVLAAGGTTLRRAAWSRDGRLLAVPGDDAAVRIWEVEGQTGRTFGFNGPAWAVDFWPDGPWLAVAQPAPVVDQWDLKTGAIRRRFPVRDNRYATSVQVSWDGKTLAAGSNAGRTDAPLGPRQPLPLRRDTAPPLPGGARSGAQPGRAGGGGAQAGPGRDRQEDQTGGGRRLMRLGRGGGCRLIRPAAVRGRMTGATCVSGLRRPRRTGGGLRPAGRTDRRMTRRLQERDPTR
jgi:hypothetical protein